MRNPVLGSKRPQRFPRRPPAMLPRLLPRLPSHLPPHPPLASPARSGGASLSPHTLPCFPQLPRELRPGEIATQRRMRNPVLGSKRPQRFPRRPPAHELL